MPTGNSIRYAVWSVIASYQQLQNAGLCGSYLMESAWKNAEHDGEHAGNLCRMVSGAGSKMR